MALRHRWWTTRLVFEARVSHSDRRGCFLGHRSVSSDKGLETRGRGRKRGLLGWSKRQRGKRSKRGRTAALSRSVGNVRSAWNRGKTVAIGVAGRTASALVPSRNGGFGRAQEILSTLREASGEANSLPCLLFSLTAALRQNSKPAVFEIYLERFGRVRFVQYDLVHQFLPFRLTTEAGWITN